MFISDFGLKSMFNLLLITPVNALVVEIFLFLSFHFFFLYLVSFSA